ncbi:MAG: hypothetical protein KA116_03955 [Proteobacteria bacterium]|nr:hypothetical protein [Pseudomonadota bacterium]
MKAILILADPIESLKPKTDTTLPIIAEFLKRNFELYYCDIANENVELDSSEYLSSLHCSRILSCTPNSSPFLRVDSVETHKASDFSIILNRKDPPVDNRYLKMLEHFEQVPQSILQVNHPRSVRLIPEHEYPLYYPEYSIPTVKCKDLRELLAALQAHSGESVVKPHNSAAGHGIKKFTPQINEDHLAQIYSNEAFPLIVQPFVSRIRELGDVRILSINSKIIGSILRRAAEGSWLSNLAQGGTAEPHTPTEKQLEAVNSLAPKLASQGVYLVGFDFIGDRISEINVTSPTCLVQINEFNNQKQETLIVDEILDLQKNL